MNMIMSLGLFMYATCIDLNIAILRFGLGQYNQENLHNCILPWGFYHYNILPMGVVVTTDIFQSRLLDLLGDLEYVVVYLDDILMIVNGTFEEHVQQASVVFTRLVNAGMQVNPWKTFWFQEEAEYIGYKITREGIKL